MTTEELRSLLHWKVLRSDLKTEAYDGSSRAGVVQKGALTEASSEILGDHRAKSVDPSALSRSGPKSIKSEADGGESASELEMTVVTNGGVVGSVSGVEKAVWLENRAAVEENLHNSRVFSRSSFRSTRSEANNGNLSELSSSLAKSLRDEWNNDEWVTRNQSTDQISVGLRDFGAIRPDLCGSRAICSGSGQSRVDLRGSTAEVRKSGRNWLEVREYDRIGIGLHGSVNEAHESNRIGVEISYYKEIKVESLISSVGYGKIGARSGHLRAVSGEIQVGYAISGRKKAKFSTSGDITAESAISNEFEVWHTNSNEIWANPSTIVVGPHNLVEIEAHSGVIWARIARSNVFNVGTINFGMTGPKLHGLVNPKANISSHGLSCVVKGPIPHQHPL